MSLKRFDAEDILISSEKVSVPIWSNNSDTLRKAAIPVTQSAIELDAEGHPVLVQEEGDCKPHAVVLYEPAEDDSMFVHVTQEAGLAGKYYIDVFDRDEEDDFKAAAQFAIAYGNKDGLGSREFSLGVDGKSPSSVVWGQFRSLVLGDEDQDFVFGYGNNKGSYAATSFFAIVVERARFKEALRPGTLKLKFENKSDDGKDLEPLVLVDNSRFIQSERYVDSGRVYELVESVGNEIIYPEEVGSYGYLLPDIGVIILNAEALKRRINLTIDEERHPWDDTNINQDFGTGWNMKRLFNILTEFQVQSEETVTSNYIFARARNSEFNYSTNPTNIDDAGELKHNIMINSPQAFITAIGLYNDANDLLAVAKLSRPLVKDFTKEALIRIKLDY